MQFDVSIIIVQTFEAELIRQTLRTLRKAAPKVSYEIIIADNRPADGFAAFIAPEFPEVKVLPQAANNGFGAGMNSAAKVAKGEYLLILNPDIVVGEGSIEKLVETLRGDDSIGLVAPRLQNADGTLQYSCALFPEWYVPILRRTPLGKTAWGKAELDRIFLYNQSHDELSEIDWAMGSAMMISAKLFFELGGFDERFFMYYEDTDLCRRVKQRGLKVMYQPEARMVHYLRRASADGGLLRQLTSRYTWYHLISGFKYFSKHGKAKKE